MNYVGSSLDFWLTATLTVAIALQKVLWPLMVLAIALFTPRDAMRRAGLCDSDVSVRLFVTAGTVSKRRES